MPELAAAEGILGNAEETEVRLELVLQGIQDARVLTHVVPERGLTEELLVRVDDAQSLPAQDRRKI